MGMYRQWPGIYPVPPVTPYLSPNYVPAVRQYARVKDVGLQNQMRRALNDRYAHGAVWDMNPIGPVWDLDPRPRRFRSQFPPAPELDDVLDMIDDMDDMDEAFGADEAEGKKKPFQKLKEAVIQLTQKQKQSAGEVAKQQFESAKKDVQQLVAPRPQPPIIIHTPAQQRQDTTSTVVTTVVATAAVIGVLGAGWYFMKSR